jgi:hypothetical protein
MANLRTEPTNAIRLQTAPQRLIHSLLIAPQGPGIRPLTRRTGLDETLLADHRKLQFASQAATTARRIALLSVEK